MQYYQNREPYNRNRNWWETLCDTRNTIHVKLHVYNLNDNHSAVWLLYGTPSRNTQRAREGGFRYLSGRNEFYEDFYTRQVSGMRIGYDLYNRLRGDIIIPVSKLVGDTPMDVLRGGGFELTVEVDFEAFRRGDDHACVTTLRR